MHPISSDCSTFGTQNALRVPAPIKRALTTTLACGIALSACADTGGDDEPSEARVVPDTVVVVDPDLGEWRVLEPESEGSNVVTTLGGTLTWSDPTDPEFTVRIDIPEGAVGEGESIQLQVELAPVDALDGLPEGTFVQTPAIRIEANGSDYWNEYRLFDEPVRVTLPLVTDPERPTALGYYSITDAGTLEAMGLESMDHEAGSYTFITRTFHDSGHVAPADTIDGSGDAVAAGSGDADEADADADSGSGGSPKSLGVDELGTRLTRHVYVGVGLELAKIQQWITLGFSVDTGFRPSVNGWHIPNYGSYYNESRGGNCWGMVAFASHYYGAGYGPGLTRNYWDPNRTESWIDDGTAIELASRAHNAVGALWDTNWGLEVVPHYNRATDIAHNMLGALYITGKPAIIYILQQHFNAAENKWIESGAHAISTYAADLSSAGIYFRVFDPNKRTPPDSDTQGFQFVPGTGFQNYLSGPTTAESDFQYNFFAHIGFYVGISHAAYDAMKSAADANFEDDSVFPRFAIDTMVANQTAEDVLNNELSETPSGQPAYVTNDTAVRLRGSVSGGLALTDANRVTHVHVQTSQAQLLAPLDANGQFEVVIPLKSGFNMVTLLASDPNRPFSHWAAFQLLYIESRAMPAAVNVTMSWNAGASDIDLYVREPGTDGVAGDTVYYSHRRGVSETSPFLDFDNTSGYGPEHYIGRTGMSTLRTDGTPNPDGLYGTYNVAAHYYADHDSDPEEVQVVGYSLSWRYLLFCPDPCEDPESDGVWAEESTSGSLGSANSGAAGNIDNGDASWSAIETFTYLPTDQEGWSVPESHEFMLP